MQKMSVKNVLDFIKHDFHVCIKYSSSTLHGKVEKFEKLEILTSVTQKQ